MAEFGFLFYRVLLPILLLIGLGAALRKVRPLDLKTLSAVQVYLFVPAFLFVRVVESSLSWREMAWVSAATLLTQFILGALVYGVLIWRRVSKQTLSAVLLASVVYNAGNFGIPVAQRAFGDAGGAVQALVVMCANLSLWGIGYALSAALTGGGWAGILSYFKLPMVYCMFVALLVKALKLTIPEPLLYTTKLLADGIVPLALVTLGAQLGGRWRMPRWKVVAPVVFVKLILLPAIATAVVFALHLWPWPGAMLIVAAAGPTAVNVLLLAMEQDGDIELAADCVFWTTLLATVTVTVILAAVIRLGGHP